MGKNRDPKTVAAWIVTYQSNGAAKAARHQTPKNQPSNAKLGNAPDLAMTSLRGYGHENESPCCLNDLHKSFDVIQYEEIKQSFFWNNLDNFW